MKTGANKGFTYDLIHTNTNKADKVSIFAYTHVAQKHYYILIALGRILQLTMLIQQSRVIKEKIF